jgi:feruloyl esterase
MARSRLLLITALIAGTAPAVPIGQDRSPGAPLDAAARCRAATALPRETFPNPTTIITAAVINAATTPASDGAGTTPALPEHCELVGRMDERVGVSGQRYAINFRLRLPTSWNGRFFFQGGTGTNGNVGNALGNLQGQQTNVALAGGYAVVSQDSGHDNATNNDPRAAGPQTFGFDPQARIDFGYRSYDEVTRMSKSVIRAFYGRQPERSYFAGCSEGGREGLMLAQRFPEHFDGILACAPGLRMPHAAVAQAFDSQTLARVAQERGLRDPHGQAFLNRTFTDADLALVSTAVSSACDLLDGAADGMVQDFTRCTTALVTPHLAEATCRGPKTEACLTATQVDALVTLFDGAKTSTGEAVYAPWAWDTGIGGRTGANVNSGWRSWKIGGYSAPINSGLNVTLGGAALAAVFLTPPRPVPTMRGGGAAFALSFDIDSYHRGLTTPSGAYREASVDFMRADATDLSAFHRRGGKLIIAHGASDPVFSVLDTIHWFDEMTSATRDAHEFARLFAVPGMNHCFGGPATDRFDAFDTLVNWVEQGTAPETITATAGPSSPWPGRTRPLCAYPAVARYTGAGSLEDATNFVCR